MCLFDARVDRAGVGVCTRDRRPAATAQLGVAHFLTIAVDVIQTRRVVGPMSAALEILIATIARARDVVVALRVVFTGAAERRISRVHPDVEAPIFLASAGGARRSGLRPSVSDKRTPHGTSSTASEDRE